MAKLSKEPAHGISEEERKTKLAKTCFVLRINKRTGGSYTVNKRQVNKAKKSKI